MTNIEKNTYLVFELNQFTSIKSSDVTLKNINAPPAPINVQTVNTSLSFISTANCHQSPCYTIKTNNLQCNKTLLLIRYYCFLTL